MKIDRTRLFDKRVVQRNIRAGRVTKDEYRAWLGDQTDARDKITARDEGGDDDGYEILPKAPAPAVVAAPVVAAAPVAAPVVVAVAPAPATVVVAPEPAVAAPAVVAPAAAAPAPAPAPAEAAPEEAAPEAHEPPPSDQAS